MAQLSPDLSFTGRIGNITAYRMKGSDKIILRSRGGAKKSRIKNAPEFEEVRLNYTEFGGRSTASKYVRMALTPLKPLADYNIAGPINQLIKPIQLMDVENAHGKRSICFTKNPKLLEGFSLNRSNPFDSIVRNPLSYNISKEEFMGTIGIPAMIPGINFHVPPGKYPFYSFIAVLGIVPDIVFNIYRYEPGNGVISKFKSASSDWYPVLKGSPAITLETKLQFPGSIPAGTDCSLMLSMGIRFGTVGMNEEMQQVKHAGAAKILAMM